MNRVVITKVEFPVKDMTPKWWPVEGQSHQKRQYADGRTVMKDIWYVPKPGYPGNNVLCLEFYDNE
jgi:hypothetical protein